jgi:2-aminoadipate transaminase
VSLLTAELTHDPRLAQRVGAMRPSLVREMVAAAARRPLLSLAGGLPPDDAFPQRAIADAAARLLAQADPSVLQYSPTEGDPALIEVVVSDLRERLDITVNEGDVVITSGSQQALDLSAKVLIDPGDVAVVERPAYVGALRALSAYQAQIVGVSVDDDGMDTAHLAALLDDGLRPKLCYVVPNFSNPSGATMSAARRVHLAELSERYGFVVVEDDPYGQLRFAGTDVAPIASHGVGNVLYLGSFSKVVAPALRVGYLTAPAWLTRPMVVAKQATDLTSSAFNQRLIVELFTTNGWLADHVKLLRELYAARADVLLSSLATRVGTRLHARRPEGGMFVWASVAVPGIDASALTAACLRHDVAIVPGTEFTVDGTCAREVRLSFSVLSAANLDEAVARMARGFDDLEAHDNGRST